jgi:hypothetical protein
MANFFSMDNNGSLLKRTLWFGDISGWGVFYENKVWLNEA